MQLLYRPVLVFVLTKAFHVTRQLWSENGKMALCLLAGPVCETWTTVGISLAAISGVARGGWQAVAIVNNLCILAFQASSSGERGASGRHCQYT